MKRMVFLTPVTVAASFMLTHTSPEVEITPSYSFSEFTADFANPFVDVISTLGTSIANGYTDAYYNLWKHESPINATHYNSYEVNFDWSFKENGYERMSQERADRLMVNTVSVAASVILFKVNFPLAQGKFANGLANFAWKTPTKIVVVKATEVTLESVHQK